MKQSQRLSTAPAVCYFGLYMIIALSLMIRQPFGSPPDENNRFLVPQYIAQHGALPNGYDEEIRIGGYGFSYAFQPILPYIVQGYVMRFVGMFTESADAALYAARGVNVFFGLVMAVFVVLLGRKWFREERFVWLFSFLVTFLPQAIFMHTYVNTDSCCMMSTAILLYGLTCGLQEGFRLSSALLLALGIVLCAMSYYNAYGYILSSILLFSASYLTRADGKTIFRWKPFIKWGCFISALVLAGIAWWFIRSAILYDGDFLGLQARERCATLYAVPEQNPETRVTWQNQGYSVLAMLSETTFLELSRMSFIGIFGAMSIPLSMWTYRFYRVLFFGGVMLSIFLPSAKCRGTAAILPERKALNIFFHANLVFCILMPLILSIQYSYTTDYQPQGRYLLPALVPFGYYCVRGIEKLSGIPWGRLSVEKRERLSGGAVVLLCLAIAVCILTAVFGRVYPYYANHPGAL